MKKPEINYFENIKDVISSWKRANKESIDKYGYAINIVSEIIVFPVKVFFLILLTIAYPIYFIKVQLGLER